MFPGPRSIIKFPDSARNRNPEEYKGTVFYRTFVLLAPFYYSGTRCMRLYADVSSWDCNPNDLKNHYQVTKNQGQMLMGPLKSTHQPENQAIRPLLDISCDMIEMVFLQNNPSSQEK